jgi:asparagine synthase (glutamine-hydrolysing)
MNNSLKHRGPDDEGYFLSASGNVGLAQRRLSILDLSPLGHQPMQSGHCWITFNGEVYNFQEIKGQLLNKGYTFKGNSDTEVILNSYQEWGSDCLSRFRGMFAFSIWDEAKQKMFLARDRVGVKPLYYYWQNGLLVFASELKAIIQHPAVNKELNFEALSLFLQMGCVPAPYSIFQNIYKLEPGHYLEITSHAELIKKKYWEVADYYLKKPLTSPAISETEAKEKLEGLLAESFKLRMVSDVEVGMFLSGGIDSSTVAGILTKKLGYQNIKTFTIGFEEKEYNEAQYAKKIAQHLGTDHHEIYCSLGQAKGILPKLTEIYDEPFGDSSAIPTYLVSQFARQFVKVSLSADGGDEMFAGYDRYFVISDILQKFGAWPKPLLKTVAHLGQALPAGILAGLYQAFSWALPKTTNIKRKIWKLKRKADKLQALIKNPKNPVLFYQLLGYGFWKQHEISQLFIKGTAMDSLDYLAGLFSQQEGLRNLAPISQMQLMDYKSYLTDDLLVKVDRATMAWGLEGRDPLLDHKLIEFAASLPLNLKYHNGVSKYLLRQVLYQYVPKEYLDRPKQGFSIPLERWLKGDLRFLLDDYLSQARIKREGLFNWQMIKEEKERFLNHQMDYTDHLWLLIVFEMWAERWYD